MRLIILVLVVAVTISAVSSFKRRKDHSYIPAKKIKFGKNYIPVKKIKFGKKTKAVGKVVGVSLGGLLSSMGVAASYTLFDKLREQFEGDQESINWINAMQHDWESQQRGYTTPISLGSAAVTIAVLIYVLKKGRSRCRDVPMESAPSELCYETPVMPVQLQENEIRITSV